MHAIRGEIDTNSDDSDSIESDDAISDDKIDHPGYTWVKSQFSCQVADILSIILGGMSSKFW